MGYIKWKEVRKDCELNEQNELIVKKVTLEPEHQRFSKKDRLDLFFRFVGLIAIGIPIFLVYLQQRASLRTQKALLQAEAYSKVITEMNSILTRDVNSAEFVKSRENLAFELAPRIDYLFGEEVREKLEYIINTFKLYAVVATNISLADSLYKSEMKLSSVLYSYRSVVVDSIDGQFEYTQLLGSIKSLISDLPDISLKLRNWHRREPVSDTQVLKVAYKISEINESYLSFHNAFAASCDNVFTILRTKKTHDTYNEKIAFDSLYAKKERLKGLKSVLLEEYIRSREKILEYLQFRWNSLQLLMRKSNKLLGS